MYISPILTYVSQGALGALRRAGRASIAAELDDAVAEIRLLFGLHERGHDLFHACGILERGVVHAKSAADANAVRVGDDCGLAVNVSEHQIRDLPSDAGHQE